MAHDIVMAAAGVSTGAAEYVEDVFSTWLYTGNGSTQTITNGIALADGSIVSPENSTALPSVSNFRFNSVAFGNGLYVAIGEIITGGDRRTTSYATSPDGINWTARSSLPNSIWQSIVFANGLFVAVSRFQSGLSDSIVATSTDGLTWNTSTSGFPTSYDARNISYANNIYFIVGSTISTGYRSTNGTTWTTFTTFGDGESGFSWDGIAFGNGRYVLIGGGAAFSSTNLSTWTSTNASVSTTHGIAFGNGVFVVVGGGGYSVSTDGVSFTNYTNITSASGSGGISFNGTNFVWATTGTQARVNVSTNATSWTAYQIAAPAGNLITTSRTNGAVVLSSSQNGRYVGTVSSFTPAVLGKGGMVWLKGRSVSSQNAFYDTARGANNLLPCPDVLSPPRGTITNAGPLNSFTSNGFTLSTDIGSWNLNNSGQTYTSWTFRDAPKFFDVVTWTGNGTDARAISHSLGSTPGMIFVKCTSTETNWTVWHRSANISGGGAGNANAHLNLTNAFAQDNGDFWGNRSTATYISPTSTNFTVSDLQNQSGRTFVAYIFAHNAGGFGDAGTDNIISCGSVTFNGTGVQEFDIGYEAQFVLIKRADGAQNWWMFDIMRGMDRTNGLGLRPNNAGTESNFGVDGVFATATGFGVQTANFGSGTYIYMAIRRPMKKPTSGTEVFSPVAQTGNTSGQIITTGFPVDLSIATSRDGNAFSVMDRLRGGDRSGWRYLQTTSTQEDRFISAGAFGGVSPYWSFQSNTGIDQSVFSSSQNMALWNFRRAPGFFDIVCYTGTGSPRTVAHNLGVAPELIIVKGRSGTGSGMSWGTYVAPLGANRYFNLEDGQEAYTNNNVWNNTAPTSTVFSVGTAGVANTSSMPYVAYLFATLAGVSKVGSYTGNGSSQTINCGFSSGARFVLIKRSTPGDWCVFDTARGIVSGNDPFLQLNLVTAEVTGQDAVDPVSSGFIVNETTEALNTNGQTYIYLAIA